MRFHISTAILLAIGAISVEGHLHGHDNSHGKAVSYSILTKHDNHHSGHGSHSYDHVGHQDKSHLYTHHVEHHGGHIDHGHHIHHGQHGQHGHAKYDFKYGVKDAKTGDVKNQWESRNGDKVKGVYSVKEADGTTRVVKYSADHKKGFQATVHKIGHAKHGGHYAQQQHSHYMHHSHGHHMHRHNVNHDRNTRVNYGHHGLHVNHGFHGLHSHRPATSYVYINRHDKH